MNRTPILPPEMPQMPRSSPAPLAPPSALALPFARPKFDALLLVCGRCADRSNGPSKRKAKKVPGAFKKALGSGRPRVRVVESSCLGLCPRKATAVAVATGEGPLQVAAVDGKSDARVVAEGLLQGRKKAV